MLISEPNQRPSGGNPWWWNWGLFYFKHNLTHICYFAKIFGSWWWNSRHKYKSVIAVTSYELRGLWNHGQHQCSLQQLVMVMHKGKHKASNYWIFMRKSTSDHKCRSQMAINESFLCHCVIMMELRNVKQMHCRTTLSMVLDEPLQTRYPHSTDLSDTQFKYFTKEPHRQ